MSLAGKVDGFAMMVALPLFLLGHAPFRWRGIAPAAAWVTVPLGPLLAWSAAGEYVPTGRAFLADAPKGHESEQDEHLVANSGVRTA